MRLLMVSNRLPVTVERRAGTFSFKGSVGGLATGLGSFYEQLNSVWLGWSGIRSSRLGQPEREELDRLLMDRFRCVQVPLSEKEVAGYYEGFSNHTLWPLFHQFTQYTSFERDQWEAYKTVNRRFADVVVETHEAGDAVWVHDYHLMLLPGLLRKRMPEAPIGFFLHIPWPSFEVFRQMPWREEVLEGLLGADLIGFHTYDYARAFLNSVVRLTGYDHSMGRVSVGNRLVKVDVFPMGIDFEKYSSAGRKPQVKREVTRARREARDRRIILSVDRLDYTKGIGERLEAFDDFLDRYPEYREKVIMVMVAVPTRDKMKTYQDLKQRVDEMVGAINGKYGTLDWMPVLYMYRSLPFNNLAALYVAAEVALVTPLYDGMNLVAKEFLAARAEETGVLVLSEMAGAARELGEAIVVNPYDRQSVVEGIRRALEMPAEEQRVHNRVLRERLRRYDVVRWAHDFIDGLGDIKQEQYELASRRLNEGLKRELVAEYRNASHRLILLDYDGSLVPFSRDPAVVRPDTELRTTLEALVADPRNEVVLISGRDRATLEGWLGDLDLGWIVEHGARVRERGGGWESLVPQDGSWKEQVRPLVEQFVDRTPGTFIEEKEFSLVWHYRGADPELARERARELKDSLLHFAANLDLGVLEGNKVLEVKNAGINKGRAALRWVARDGWDFVLAMGDDKTDEDTFAAVPEWAYSIKVGWGPSRAKFNAESVTEARSILKGLVEADGAHHGGIPPDSR